MKLLNKKLAIISTVAVFALLGIIIGFALAPDSTDRTEKEELKSLLKEENIVSKGTVEGKIQPLEEDTISVLFCGVDMSEKLTDVIMYVQFDTRKKEVNVLRIPRDVFVGKEFPTSKINAIYGHPYENMSGIESMKQYLETNWKLDIDYYATITLEGMRNIIDDLGGIKMNVPQTINYLPGKVLYPGEQILDGEKSEWIIRYRAGYENGDLGRIDAQAEFLGACIDTAKQKGRVKCLSVLMGNYKQVETDMPLDKMIAVASNLYELDKSNLSMYVVPGKGTMYYTYAVYQVDKEGLLTILNENFATQGKTFSEEDIILPQVPAGSGSYNQPPKENNWNQTENQNDEYNQSNKNDVIGDSPYVYDENGNPLYQLDENGQPIYQYDEEGNVTYIYQMQEEQQRQQDQKKLEQGLLGEDNSFDQQGGNSQQDSQGSQGQQEQQEPDGTEQDQEESDNKKIIKKKKGAE